MDRKRAGAAFTALCLSLIVVACGSGGAPAAGTGSPAATSGGLSVQYEGVELKPDVVVVDAAAVTAGLRSVSEDGTTFRFAPGTKGVGDLRAGRVLVLEGRALRKVASVSENGGDVVVETTEATLDEAISKGRIGWDYGLRWDELPEAAYGAEGSAGPVVTALGANDEVIAAEALRRVAARGKEVRFNGTIKGYEVELKLVPRPDKLEYELAAQRQNIKVQAKGSISNFLQDAHMEYDGGKARFFEARAYGLQGDAELQWAAFSVEDPSLDDDITAFQVPLSLPIPIAVGPIPMQLEIKAALRMVPALSVQKASSGGAFKVTYKSDQGFRFDKDVPSPLAQLHAANATLGSKETVTAGMGPAGFGFGFEFPRMELGILGGSTYMFLTLNTYVSGEFTPGTTLTNDIPPCQKASTRLSGIAGYRLSVLGFANMQDQKTLWQQQWDKFKDDKPCTLTGS